MVDWWSLGVFTYEMLFGLPPFYSENQDAMFDMINKDDIKWPSHTHISEKAKSFILRCTDRDPKKRLGYNGDVEELKKHPWFENIDFGKLLKKEVTPPF
jgi:serum/glucocorticoid-regulated kinase 2